MAIALRAVDDDAGIVHAAAGGGVLERAAAEGDGAARGNCPGTVHAERAAVDRGRAAVEIVDGEEQRAGAALGQSAAVGTAPARCRKSRSGRWCRWRSGRCC